MAAYDCPKCGNSVMTYGRFLREAEPYRTSSCGSCGAQLRRSPKVYLLLLVSVGVLAAIVAGFLAALSQGLSIWWLVPLGVIWTILTNYMGYRLIPWLPADNQPRSLTGH